MSVCTCVYMCVYVCTGVRECVYMRVSVRVYECVLVGQELVLAFARMYI